MGIRVPMYTPEVQAQAAPIVRMGNLPDNGMGAVAQGIGNVGNALSNIDKMQQDFNKQADSLAVEDKVNQLVAAKIDLTVGSDTVQGYRARMGKNVLPENNGGVSLTGDYMGKFSKVQEDLSTQLTNDKQKELFRQRAAVISNDLLHGVEAHQMQQAQEHTQQIIHTALKSSGADASINWNSPETINSYLARVDGVIASAGVAGMAGLTADQLRHDAISDIHHGVMIGALAAGQTDYAANYLKQNAKALNTNQLLDVQSKLNQGAMDNAVVSGTDTLLREFTPRVLPDNTAHLVSAAGPLMPSLIHAESSGKQSAVSPKGAVGVAQVMPNTGIETAAKHGITWDEKRFKTDPTYNARLGELYLGDQLEHFGGDVAKAVAAYNAGPDAVEKRVAQYGNDWLAHMPNETKLYVPKVLGSYQQGTTAPPMPSLMDMKARARQLAGNNGQLALRLDTEAERLYTNLEKARKDDGEQAYSDAMKILDARSGDMGAVPAELKRRIPGEKLSALNSFASTLASGEAIKTPMPLYARLSDDRILGGMTDKEFNNLSSVLAPADFKHFVSERKRVQTGSGGNDVTDVNGQEVKGILFSRLSSVGIDPTPKGDDVAAQGRVGVITQQATNAVRDFQTTVNRKATQKETQDIIDRELAKPQAVKSWLSFLGAADKKIPALTATVSQLDSKVVDAIKADFAKNNITDPTDSQILGVYFETKRQADARAELQRRLKGGR